MAELAAAESAAASGWTSGSRWLTRRSALLIFVAVAAIVRILAAVHSGVDGLFDDAYVTLRYAANMVQGLGPVFNPGEHVLGTTSPLHALILAAFCAIFGASHLEGITVALGTLFSLGFLLACERVLVRAGIAAEVKWAYLFVLAFLPAFVANGASGMETPLVLLLMALSLVLTMQRRLVALACVAVLLFLTRIDTGIWLVALGVHILLDRDRFALRSIAVPLMLFLAAMLAWLIFSKLYYGSIVPESIVGKALHHGAFALPDWQYAVDFASAFVPIQRLGIPGLGLVALVFIALVPSTMDLWRHCRDLRPVIIFTIVYIAVFFIGRSPLFSWYAIPSKWAFYLLAVYSSWWWLKRQQRIAPAAALTIIALASLILGASATLSALRTGPAEKWTADLSALIERHVDANGRVFLEHIGLVGFRTNRYLYDYGGLVTPRTNQLKREFGRAWLTRALREYQADAVVLYDGDMPAVAAADDADAAWFRESYDQVETYHSGALVISVFFLKSSRWITR